MQEISAPCGIHCITLPTPFAVGDVNVFIVVTEKITLVDAAVRTQEAWDHFRKELMKIGYTIEDIDQVVITHHHPDHIGLLDYLPADLPVYGHRFTQPWLTKDSHFFEMQNLFYRELFSNLGAGEPFLKEGMNFREPITLHSHRSLTQVREGDQIPGLQDWKVLETPGHAQSHIVLYNKQKQLLIGGDLLISHISSNPLVEPPMEGGVRPKTLLQYNHSLRRVRDLNVALVYSGHGKVVTNVNTLITERLHKQEKRAQKVCEMLKIKPMTALQVCKEIFPKVYEKELVLTLSETLGQLDYLEVNGYIRVDTTKSVWIYNHV